MICFFFFFFFQVNLNEMLCIALASIILTLLFDAPFQNIKKIILRNSSSIITTTTTHKNNNNNLKIKGN